MILRKYGIELRSITSSDIERIRTWRNDRFVRDKMFYQKEITTIEQQVWFDSLEVKDQYYMIIFEELSIGVINVKNINFERRTGEAGVFIGVKEYRNLFVPMLAILCMMDAFFNEFSFTELQASLRSDNKEALAFNLDLGYSILKTTADRIEIHITADDYKKQMEGKKEVLKSFNRGVQEYDLSTEENHLFRLK